MLSNVKADQRQPAVLVVEDDLLQREEMVDVLTRRGMRVVAAQNGFAAMHQLRRTRAAVVVLDLNMPGLDGLQVAHLMQQLDFPPKLIFVSGYARHISQAHKEDLGAFAIVEKPIAFPVLARFIHEAMGIEPDDGSMREQS